MRFSTKQALLISLPLLAVTARQPQCVASEADRAAAEWVFHVGGSVVLSDQKAQIWDITNLPAADFELRIINLSGALVAPMDLQRISRLPHLKELYLSGRTWHSMPVAVSATTFKMFQGLPSLEKLILTLPVQVEIPLEDPALANLAPLTHLQELRLAQTRVRGHTLASFKEMRCLDLTNTRLDDEGMQSLQYMTHLEKLYAHDALITDEGLQYISGLRNLTELDLYNTKITDAGLANLKNLTRLRKLNLLGAAVTDGGLDQLTGLTELEELNLYRSKITNAGLEKLKSFKRLREVDVRYTLVNRGGVSSLRAANLTCHIEFLDTSVAVSHMVPGKPVAGEGAQAVAVWVRAHGGSVVLENAKIREVSLSSASVTDADLRNLRGLPSLQKLDLRGTEIGDLGVRNLELDQGCAITGLSLSNTTVSDASLASLAKCKQLAKLDLSYTLLHGEGLDGLRALDGLADLQLTGDVLSETGIASMAKLRNLKRLDLKYSDIEDGGIAKLQGLSQLTRLDLTGTNIGDAGLASLSALSRLSELLLSYGRFTDEGLQSLQHFPNLTRLDLVKTRTTDRSLSVIGTLINLSSLNLDYTGVSDHGLHYLASLPQLTQLRLDSATITDAGLETLKSCQHLKNLNLYHTLVTENGIEALKKALPSCKVVWDRGSNLPTRRGS